MDQTYLIVTGTEDEFSVGIPVENPLDNFTLVHCDRSHFEVLLSNENYTNSDVSVIPSAMEANNTYLRLDAYEQGCSPGDPGIVGIGTG